ncbi:GtrA family protein [Clostridium guangxiense]|uniref:GtrA family protein n=1 Tax=Clostridium guangxiense TaxID=1662055 RepID=UPI001E608D88|nr:GtrA family protein [Clostridium guangxiense]MCD2348305.1 GtrA family protein [Clostridium guangxiense]
MKIKQLYKKYKSIIKFGIVGCINTGVDFFTFTLLLSIFGIDKLVCQVGGYSMGVINSFVLNKLWTFNDKKEKVNPIVQFAKFVITNIISLGISLVGLNILSNKFYINVYVSKVIVTLFLQVFNYVVYKLFIFKGKANKQLAA